MLEGVFRHGRGEFFSSIVGADGNVTTSRFTFSDISANRYRWDAASSTDAGLTWEIDEFEGINSGLIVAEIELEHEDQPFSLPPWAGAEVSSDPKYLNASLAVRPYSEWER